MIQLTPEKPPYYENVEQIKIYTALLTQTGTAPPTAIILKNTLGATPIWTRDDVGLYIITLEGAFPLEKTTYFVQSTGSGLSAIMYNAEDGTPSNALFLETDVAGDPADLQLYNTPLTITIYP